MPTYLVNLTYPCYVQVEVDADTPEQAEEAVFDSEDMPGELIYRGFNESPDGPQVDGGEWLVTSVQDTSGNILLDSGADS